MIISCPFCGRRNQHEFTYWYEADTVFPPLDAPVSVWAEAVFERRNTAGRAAEIWNHTQGCRLWLRIERNTITHEIHSIEPVNPAMDSAVETTT